MVLDACKMILILKNIIIICGFLLCATICQAQQDGEPIEKRHSFTVQIKANPKVEDAYCSTRMNVPEWALGRTVIGFEPLPGFAAHHMILYMCENEPLWANVDQREDQCNESEGVMRLCGSIQFVWANGGLPLYLPPHVGLKLGNTKGQASFALQVHFGSTAKTWSDRSGVRLILTEEDRLWDKPEVWLLVPYNFPKLSPGQSQIVVGDRERRRASSDLMVFAVRVHSHNRGVWNEVSVYRDEKEVWKYRRSTSLPQSFIPLPEHVYIKKNDEVRFKCAYDTSNEDHATGEGATRHEEMCNVYLMYYRLPGVDALEESTGHHVKPHTHLRKIEDCVSSTVSAVPLTSQIVGVSASSLIKASHLYVFHRGNTIWGPKSFTSKEVFTGDKISTDVIMKLDANSLEVLGSMGANQFYMPHSIKVDPENENIVWLCDVGAHQVIEYDVTLKQPRRKLGVERIPGRSQHHFCKPTDVAFSSDNKLVYVTDGYCNSRIVVFNKKDLTFVRELGANLFIVPHAISVIYCGAEENELLVVADRENARVQILRAKDGSVLQNIQSWGPGSYPYSIAVDPITSRLFAGLIRREWKSKGSIWMSNHGICDLPTGATLEGDSICDAEHNGFEEPHMITLFGRKLFVAESGGGKLHGRLAQVSF